MGGIKDRQASQDIWHLTIDDLFATPAEISRLGGDGPFVINLTASTAPISIPPKSALNFDRLHVYQVTRTEGGSQRFRLRLGPISTELEADAILASVRERYPSALTATASEDDLRAIASATRVAQATQATQAPKAPKAPKAPMPPAKTATAKENPLPPVIEVQQVEDASEITGTGWDLDSLLPHLAEHAPTPRAAKTPTRKLPDTRRAATAPAPAPVKPAQVANAPTAPQAAPAAAPRATGAKAVAPPPAAAPQPPVSGSTASPPLVAKSTPARPTAKAPVRNAVSPPPVLTTPAAPSPVPTAAAPTPPVLTAAIAPPPPAPSPVPIAAAPTPPVPTAAIAPPPPAPSPVPTAAAPTPPVLTAAIVPPPAAPSPVPTAAAPTPPVLTAAIAPRPPAPSAPLVAVVAPTMVEQVVPPIATEAAVSVIDEISAPAVEKLAQSVPTPSAPLVVEVTAPPPPVKAATPRVVEPPPAKKPAETRPAPLTLSKPARVGKPVTVKPVVTPHAPVAPPAAETVSPPSAAIVEPKMDPLETDWAAILSAAVADTSSQATLQIAVRPEPMHAATPEVLTPAVDPFTASDESGLRRLVEKSNALVESMDTRVEVVVPVVEAPAPVAAAVVPSSARPSVEVVAAPAPVAATQAPQEIVVAPPAATIVELAPTAAFSPTSMQSIEQKLARLAELLHTDQHNGQPTPAARTHPEIHPGAQTDCALVRELPTNEVDVECSFPDDVQPQVSEGRRFWPEIDRRTEPRPTLKSATDVLTSIEDIVVVDEENNLENLLVMTNAISPSMETPVEARAPAEKSVDLPPPAAIRERDADPTTHTVRVPVLTSPVEERVVEFTLENPLVVPTVVLDKPPVVPAAEEPYVLTLELAPTPAAAVTPSTDVSPTPVVIRSRETAAEQAAIKTGPHMTLRAVAYAAKKLRAAKHAAKVMVTGAHKANGGAPARAAVPSVSKGTPPANVPVPETKSRTPSAKTPIQATHAPTAPAKAAKPPAATKPAPAPAAAARKSAPTEKKVAIHAEHLPSMETTQTIRPLTPLELADDQASKWFVIQLALSEDDFDPDHVPHLDIFEVYRLYSVIGLDQGKVMQALRLGFFSDEVSAEVVTGYLKAHFESASVKRVSIAERERFAERQVLARKDIGATGMHTVIEMVSPKPLPEIRYPERTEPAKPEQRSIWSRLVSPLKR